MRSLIHLARRNLLLGVEAAIVVEDETWRAVVEPVLAPLPWLSQAIKQKRPVRPGRLPRGRVSAPTARCSAAGCDSPSTTRQPRCTS